MTRDPVPGGVRETVHGTCVALGTDAALLRGGSGAGKSDLALRFLALPDSEEGLPRLVADDQVCLTRAEDSLMASPPPNLAGLIEVRGLGIQTVSFARSARLVVVCDLVAAQDVPRMPPDPWDRTVLAGSEIPVLKLAPFETSAPLKLRLAIVAATAHLRVVNNRV